MDGKTEERNKQLGWGNNEVKRMEGGLVATKFM